MGRMKSRLLMVKTNESLGGSHLSPNIPANHHLLLGPGVTSYLEYGQIKVPSQLVAF